MLSPFHNRTAWLNTDSRIGSGLKKQAPTRLGTRSTPRTSSAAKTQVTTSHGHGYDQRGGFDARAVHAQQAIVDAELGPALQVHQADEDRFERCGTR